MQAPPKLKLAGEASGPYIAIAVDVDAPYVSVPFVSPLVHWIQPGLKVNDAGTLEHETSSVVDWLAPSPAPFSGGHRYLVVLYQQPTDFDISRWNATFVKPVSTWSRLRWDLDDFAKKAGLDVMIAASYFCK